MTQLSEDCFAGGGALMRLDEALARILPPLVTVTEPEQIPLSEALGRILAEPAVAPIDVPPHDNSAVDGYAVFFDDLAPDRETRLPVAGRAAAGHALGRPPRRGEAIRIFTGAIMPEGPDTVMMQEDCGREGDVVIVPPGIRRGANRRRAGEDVRAGETILEAGLRLRPQDVALCAAAGIARLAVSRPLRVALLSTGDELQETGAPLPPGGIYDSNRHLLAALLRGLGCGVTDLGILPDRKEVIRLTLAVAAADSDVILTSGGVSVGEEDHVKAAVEALGRLHLWRLAIKPGRPVALGHVMSEGRTVPVVGFPGNPVAVMVTFLRVARPILLRLMGASDLAPVFYRVRAGFDYKKKRDRREWVRARLRAGEGGPVAEKYPRQGAGVLSSLVHADGLVELPEEMTELASGSMVDFLPFAAVL